MNRLLHIALLMMAAGIFNACATSPESKRSAEKGIKEWVEQFNSDDSGLTGWIPNQEALDFLKKNIPRFDCPDEGLERTYYFRWWTYRKHIRSTPEGYVVTEFLPEVPWARKYNTINCPAAHQFREGRWLHNSQILSDYARFYFGGSGKPRQYSFWAADSILNFCKVTGDYSLAIDLLDALVQNYYEWEKSRLTEDGLFWQIDDRDGMEVSAGGSGKRLTINSYMYGDAKAIAKIAALAGRDAIKEEFQTKSEKLRQLINKKLWSENSQFYKTIPYTPPQSRHKNNSPREENGPWVEVRELQGYTPWYFNIPEPGSKRGVAWKQLMDAEGFWAPYGPTTAEQRHPDFQISYEGHECKWNGPSWPYATSVTLTAMANALQNYDQSELPITRADYLKTLRTYAYSHKRETEDGRVVSWIDENLNPYTGDWLSRTILIQKREAAIAAGKEIRDPGKKIEERGKDYNHSTFCDLIISGLMGLQPQIDGSLHIHPLIPENEWDWCRLENIRYHDQLITIQWDRDGSRYNNGKGFRVFVDGKLIASAETIRELKIELPKQ